MKKGKLMSKTKETQGTPNPHGDPRHIDDDDQANCPCKTCRHYEAVNRRTHDPRRKLIAEAMAAHDGEEWGQRHQYVRVLNEDCADVADCEDVSDALSVALTHNALPCTAELIEELTAKLEREEHESSELMDLRDRYETQLGTIDLTLGGGEWSSCHDCGESAEQLAADVMVGRDRLKATIAKQAKEIEDLTLDVEQLRHFLDKAKEWEILDYKIGIDEGDGVLSGELSSPLLGRAEAAEAERDELRAEIERMRKMALHFGVNLDAVADVSSGGSDQ